MPKNLFMPTNLDSLSKMLNNLNCNNSKQHLQNVKKEKNHFHPSNQISPNNWGVYQVRSDLICCDNNEQPLRISFQ